MNTNPSSKPVLTKRNVFYAVVLFLIVFAFVWISGNKRHLTAFPSIISSFYSKEFCSCYFVVGLEEASCHNYARQWVPISSFELDTAGKKVVVSGLGKTTTAQFLDKKNGCVLQATE